MKKSRILFIAFFFNAIMLGLACNIARGPTPALPGVQSTTPAPITTTSPAPASPTPTPLLALTAIPLPSLTATPLPTSLPSANPLPTTTRTMAPFLPANLVIINSQNASKLERVAVLAEQSASVVAYSSDNRRVAAGFFATNQIKIWDLASGQELFTLSGHIDTRIISYLAFSPDGARLASGAQGWDAPNDSLILWDAGTGRELQRFSGVLGAISPDWRLVALTRREQSQGVTLILSELASGKEIHILKAPGDIYGVTFSPDGQHVAAKMYNVFQDLFSFWSVDSGQLERTLYDWSDFSYSPDGRFIAALLVTGSGMEKGELNIFDAVSFKWIKTLGKDADTLWFAYRTFSPDGQILAASFGDHVILWDTQTWKELASLPASSPTGLAFSPDGRILTTYTQKGMVLLWGVVEGE